MCGTYNADSQNKYKTSMLRSGSCDYSDAYILIKGTITVPNAAVAGAAPDNRNKRVIFKNWVPFTDSIREINNTEIDHAQYIDVVISIYNLIECSDNYSKISGRLWQ